jgi:RNA polymerase sigma factor (sigma-70 family)
MRYAANEAEAEDILQEAFIAVFRNLHTVKESGSLGGWMRRITINKALEQYRKNKSLRNLNEAVKLRQAADDFEVKVLQKLALEDLLAKIQQLPVGYRTVFNLYAIEGYTHKEIGELLHISAGTSKSQYSRARNLLADILNEEQVADEKRLNYAR